MRPRVGEGEAVAMEFFLEYILPYFWQPPLEAQEKDEIEEWTLEKAEDEIMQRAGRHAGNLAQKQARQQKAVVDAMQERTDKPKTKMKDRLQRAGVLKSRRGSAVGSNMRGRALDDGGGVAMSPLDAEIANQRRAKRDTRRSVTEPRQRPDPSAPPWERTYQHGDLGVTEF